MVASIGITKLDQYTELGCNMQERFKGFRIRHWMQLDAVAYGVVLAVVLVVAAIANVVSRFSN